MTDCLFVGGKGGVGKTTCAAATALRLAEAGASVLVVSTDPAHSLADSFDTPLESQPRSVPGVEGDLQVVEIDADASAERYERLARALAADLRSAGIRLEDEEVARIFAGGAPAGADELAALDLLVEYVDDGDWDAVVFDTAPTGHTLRLFDTPEVLGLALETTRSLRGQARRIATAARGAMFGPLAMAGGSSDEGDDLAALQARLERAREVVTDPDRTSFRVVTVPEGMAIAETERLVEQLREAGVQVDRLLVNRVLEDPHDGCPRCRSRRERHEARVAETRDRFPDLAVTTLPEREREVQGLEALSALAERLPDTG